MLRDRRGQECEADANYRLTIYLGSDIARPDRHRPPIPSLASFRPALVATERSKIQIVERIDSREHLWSAPRTILSSHRPRELHYNSRALSPNN